MNALLLAAGFGTRLRPLTDHTPKCLVDIAGRPLLDYWLKDLHAVGVTRFLLNTHHLAEKVEAYVHRHSLRDCIETVYEDKLLGTAGTLAANAFFCGQSTTLIAHADNFCLCDWNRFLDAHFQRPQGTIMTMMTFQTPNPQSCGIVKLDSRGVVEEFYEKHSSPPGNLANAAIYLMEPEVIKMVSSIQPPMSDISTELIPSLLGKINTWHNTNIVIDIGTQATLQYANDLTKSASHSA